MEQLEGRKPTRGSTYSVVGLVLVLALFGAACSKSSRAPATTQAAAPATGGAPAAGGSTGTLEQGTGDALVFSPTQLTVKKGASVTVSNVGNVPHTFTITGKGIDVENQPGQSQQLAINLPAGTYQYICRFHVSEGMKGTLTVT